MTFGLNGKFIDRASSKWRIIQGTGICECILFHWRPVFPVTCVCPFPLFVFFSQCFGHTQFHFSIDSSCQATACYNPWFISTSYWAWASKNSPWPPEKWMNFRDDPFLPGAFGLRGLRPSPRIIASGSKPEVWMICCWTEVGNCVVPWKRKR